LGRNRARPVLSRAIPLSDWVIRGNSGPNANAPY
jgi:hypothetical protein